MSMWPRYDVLSKLESVGLCQTLNLESVSEYIGVARALIEGGLTNIEILQRSGPNQIPKVHLDAIYELRKLFPEATIGAGTVHTKERAQAVIDHGAQFVVSNFTDEGVIETANLNCVLAIPGTRNDTDIRTAMRLGCWIVKVFIPFPDFPEGAAERANIAYLAQYRGCFPNMRFLLTAGINSSNVDIFAEAGYPVLIPSGIVPSGAGKELFRPDVTNQTLLREKISENAKYFVLRIKQARERLSK